MGIAVGIRVPLEQCSCQSPRTAADTVGLVHNVLGGRVTDISMLSDRQVCWFLFSLGMITCSQCTYECAPVINNGFSALHALVDAVQPCLKW